MPHSGLNVAASAGKASGGNAGSSSGWIFMNQDLRRKLKW